MKLRQFPNPLCPMIYEELLQHDLSNTIMPCAVLQNLNWKTISQILQLANKWLKGQHCSEVLGKTISAPFALWCYWCH